MIPYEDIDPEIRGLVKILNDVPGLRTEHSCVGHEIDEEAYVTLIAENQTVVANLLAALPFWGWKASFADNRPISKVIWTTVDLKPNGEVRYTLRLGGFPVYQKKELIVEIERSIREAFRG